MEPIRVLLADDHTLVRTGFRRLVQDFTGIEVVAEAGDGHESLRLIKQHRPDVALVDITMPGINGLEVSARVVKTYPRVRVIILSMHVNEEYVAQALHAGAAGYVVKNAAPAELELAIRAVARGETYLSPVISTRLISDYVRRTADRSVADGLFPRGTETLTSRQREVLQLVAEGHTTKQIAAKLNLAAKTIESHRRQLMERLDIHDLAGLVRYAIQIGLVTVDRRSGHDRLPPVGK